ncbi:hypothetical protein [Arthrobacter sp. CJ23]|uniref:hypothetical protein n=1 Tax=Arthrobacter sp. CJ23 TaxID=2972479 RepID=UPI00215C2DDE|nr:hypothetical protein [Arthrobacter sp. CJ23]UVJ40849.1 hypothetical protein NVV90_06690 [Arthrobacter sp. CJ23]
MNDLPVGISNLFAMATWAAIALLVLMALILGASRFNRWRLLKQAKQTIHDDEKRARSIQAELLECIQYYSENQRQPVNIAGFWKGHSVSRPVRSALIGELVDARVVGIVPQTYKNDFFDFIAKAWVDFFCMPPTVLILSDRDWLLMVNSKLNGQEILIERMIVKFQSIDTNNYINTGGGNVIGVAQGGSDVSLKMGDVKQEVAGADLRNLREILLALRVDADMARDSGIAAQIVAHADLLEREIKDPGAEESRGNLLERISNLVNKYGDAMVTTVRVLGSLRGPDAG